MCKAILVIFLGKELHPKPFAYLILDQHFVHIYYGSS